MEKEKSLNEEFERVKQLAFMLGRHLLNPDNLPITTWGVRGCDLLAELRKIDPLRYDIFMKSDKDENGENENV